MRKPCVCLVTLIVRAVADLNATAQREMLRRIEYPGYDSGIRPDTGEKPLEVEVDLVLNAVGSISEMDMTWSASMYLRQEWTDPRLVLGKVGNKVKLDRGNVDKLWVPDLFFSNDKDGHKHDLTVENHLVYINSSTGRLLYSQKLTVVLNCKMDLSRFPHDYQMCDIKMESYSFTTDDLVLKWSSSRAATSLLPTIYVPDFFIVEITDMDCTATYDVGTFPCLLATVCLKRQFGFYIFQTYLPSVLIVILSWVSFWIDHESIPARISVGLLTVLTITTQLTGSRTQLPRVPYIKAIDMWMFPNLVFVFAAYLEYTLVTILSRRFKKNKMKKTCRLAAKQEKETSVIQVSDQDKAATPKGQPSSRSRSKPKQKKSAGSGDPGHQVDRVSRLLFPLGYVIFNGVYWIYYLLII